MSQPYVGQVIPVGFNFAPVGWLLCDGSAIPISEYTVLFQLIGTTYGGDGQTSFKVPDLRGRVVVGTGQSPGQQNYSTGQMSGSESVTLTVSTMASHTHQLIGTSAAATSATPASGLQLASAGTGIEIYAASGTAAPLASAAIGMAAGGAQPHENRQPFQVINYIIAAYGLYPSQS